MDFKAIIDANDRRYEERFQAQDKAVNAALIAQKEAVNAALAASEKAVSVAEVNAEKWRTNANEWREAMNDRERNFLSKGMGYVLAITALITFLIAMYDKLKV